MTAADLHDWELTAEQLADKYGPDHHVYTAQLRRGQWGRPGVILTALCKCGDGIAYPATGEGAGQRAAWEKAHARRWADEVDLRLADDPCPFDASDDDPEVRWCTGYRCQGPRMGYLTLEPYERGDFFCPPSGGCFWTCDTCGNVERIEDPDYT